MEEFYSVREVAQMLKLDETTILKWLRAGKLQGKKLGKQWRIARADLREFTAIEGAARKDAENA